MDLADEAWLGPGVRLLVRAIRGLAPTARGPLPPLQPWKPAPPAPAAFQPLQEATKTGWLRPDLAAAAMTSPRFHPTTALAARRDFPWARESHGRSHPSRSRAYNSGKTPRLAAGWNECPPHRTRPESNKVSNQEASPRNTSARRTTRPAVKKRCEKSKNLQNISTISYEDMLYR